MTSIADFERFLFTSYHGLGHANVAWLKWNRHFKKHQRMDVSENSGTPKSSILIGFSIINHPLWGTPIVGNTRINGIRLVMTLIILRPWTFPFFIDVLLRVGSKHGGVFFSPFTPVCFFYLVVFCQAMNEKNMN